MAYRLEKAAATAAAEAEAEAEGGSTGLRATRSTTARLLGEAHGTVASIINSSECVTAAMEGRPMCTAGNTGAIVCFILLRWCANHVVRLYGCSELGTRPERYLPLADAGAQNALAAGIGHAISYPNVR